MVTAGCPVLEASGVVKVFDEGSQHVEVLRGVSLTVAAGEVVALEGPSGSARRRSSRSWAASSPRPKARSRWPGSAWIKSKPAQLRDVRRRSIGFVFQQYNLFPALTALENVEYALNVKGVRGRAPATPRRLRADAGGSGRPPALPAPRPLRRAEAARRHRARAGRIASGDPGRRADGEPRHRGGHAGAGAVPRPREVGVARARSSSPTTRRCGPSPTAWWHPRRPPRRVGAGSPHEEADARPDHRRRRRHPRRRSPAGPRPRRAPPSSPRPPPPCTPMRWWPRTAWS